MRLSRPDGARGVGGVAAASLALVALLAAAPRPCRAAPAGDPVRRHLAALEAQLERHRGSSRALVPLLELAALSSEVADRDRLAALYERIASATGTHPEVSALARFRLAHLERARGRLDRAEQHLARLGFLEKWVLVGPFDNTGKHGFDATFGPERDPDPGARFPGKVREVGWRTLPPEAVSAGFVHLGATVRPAREVVVYALATVESPRRRKVLLHLGASGALKVFVNGKLVDADPAQHPARFDQRVVAVTLEKGTNRVLLKLCHVEGRMGFYARIAGDAAGNAPDALAVLEGWARTARGDEAARAHYELALLLAERRPGDEHERRALDEARRAVELAPRSVPARLLAARLEPDRNERREHLARALAAAPDDARVLVALAHLDLQRGRSVEAQRLLDRALAASPRYVPARLERAELWERAGFAERARRERAALAAEEPADPAALAAAARSERAADAQESAIRLLRAALAQRHDDATSRAVLVQLLVDRARIPEAVSALQETLALAPADLDARMRLADLLAANGRAEEAEEAFARALRIAPEDPDLHERRGQARLRAGRTREALADFAVALELRPQNPQLKELVRALEPAGERFEKPYAVDLREAARLPGAEAVDADAVVLAEVHVTRVFPSGLASRFRQIVVKVLTQRGVDAWRSWATSYGPDRQEVRVDRARILKPDGSVVESHHETDQSSSEPWYRLYYDQRSRQLTFPALARGDVLEIAVRIDDVASENLLADSFGEFVFLANGTPKLRMDYVLLVPEGRTIHASEGVAGVVRAPPHRRGDLVEHRWTARDLPPVRSEPAMPGWSEVVPYVHVSTHAGWEDVARFYWALVRDQLQPTRPVREVALRIAGEVASERRARGLAVDGDERATVEAVHRFVVTNTRYVGLEFGIHGYKPYRVDDVLQRRFGDCKDKASLTHALLEALGIDSRLVLLRMRRLGRIPELPASLAVFNHAILYVPRHDLWLDGTASYSGSRDLPAEDRGATVLVLNPGEPPRFGTVPEGTSEQNVTTTTCQVALAPDGSARVEGETRVAGVHAPGLRRAYAADADRRPHLEQSMARTFPGATVRAVAVSDLARLEDDVSIRFSLAHAVLAEHDGEDLLLAPFGAGHRHTERLAPLSTRTHDLVLGAPSDTRLIYRHTVPAGLVAALPEPLHVGTPFGSLDVGYRLEGAVLVAEARWVVSATRVPVRDYGEFRAFVTQVDRALARPLRLSRRAGRSG